jgi:SH3-like domain-containing protein
MAAPVHPANGARFTGTLLSLAAFAILIAGCGPKQQTTTLPPTPPPTQVALQVVTDTAATPTVDPEAPVEKLPLKSGWIFKPLVNVRSDPSTTAPIITRLSRGTEIKLIEKIDQWWKVQLSDSTLAYVHESMVSQERYVDPWTQFKLGGRLADTTLQIITAVTELADKDAPSAALTVADSWASFSKIKKQRVAQAAFAYWKMCLSKAGYDPKGTVVVLRDAEGVDLVKVTANADKTTVDFLK